MPAVLCLDLGTSAAKGSLIELDGTVTARASRGYPTHHPEPGGAEQDPQDWIDTARAVISELLESPQQSPLQRGELLALSLTGQMQDLVPATSPAEPSPAPAILYSDTRAAEDAAAVRRHLAAQGLDWDALTGNLQDATSCAAMFRRLARTRPELTAGARHVLFGPAGYLAHRLELGAWCDPTTAAATGLLDARRREWSAPVARAAGLEPGLLPRLAADAGQVIGRTDAAASALLGLPAGIPVVLAPGDAGATTAGIIGLTPGDDYAYLGTSGWIATVLPTGAGTLADGDAGTSHHLALGAIRGAHGTHRVDGGGSGDAGSARAASPCSVLRISALLAAGAAADWARRALLDGVTPQAADALLEQRERRWGRGPTGLLALPSILGERYPVRDADLRGALIGMGPETTSIDMYAAVLEGVAHALAPALAPAPELDPAPGLDPVHAGTPAAPGGGPAAQGSAEPGTAESGSQEPRPLSVTGGGTASQPWLRILADVTGRPVRTLDSADAALIGCAILAADALGVPHGILPLAARDTARSIDPDPGSAAAHAALRPAHRALYTAVAEVRALR